MLRKSPQQSGLPRTPLAAGEDVEARRPLRRDRDLEPQTHPAPGRQLPSSRGLCTASSPHHATSHTTRHMPCQGLGGTGRKSQARAREEGGAEPAAGETRRQLITHPPLRESGRGAHGGHRTHITSRIQGRRAGRQPGARLPALTSPPRSLTSSPRSLTSSPERSPVGGLPHRGAPSDAISSRRGRLLGVSQRWGGAVG